MQYIIDLCYATIGEWLEDCFGNILSGVWGSIPTSTPDQTNKYVYFGWVFYLHNSNKMHTIRNVPFLLQISTD